MVDIEGNILFFPLQVVYAWLFPIIFKTARKKNFSVEDLPEIKKEFKSSYNFERFEKIYGKTKNLIISFLVVFGLEFWFAGILQLISVVLTVSYPIFLQNVLQLLTSTLDPEQEALFQEYDQILPSNLSPYSSENIGTINKLYRTNDWMIWIWLCSMFLCYSLSVVFQEYSTYVSSKIGMKINALLCTLLFKKRLKLSKKGERKYPSGVFLNFITEDAKNIELMVTKIHYIFGGSLIIISVFVVLYFYLGIAVLFSVAVALFLIPLVIFTNLILLRTMKKYLFVGDKRISTMREVFSGLEIIKFNSWEQPFIQKICKIRQKQFRILKIISFLKAFLSSMIASQPPILMAFGFGAYYFINGKINSSIFLTSLVFFGIIRSPLNFMPQIFTQTLMSILSFKRISGFMRQEETESYQTKLDDSKDFSIKIKNGKFSYQEKEEEKEKEKNGKPDEIEMKNKKKPFELEGINLEIKKGELVMVVGTVGSGKSSFLKAISGEMKKNKETSIEVNGEIAFVEQKPFIFNDTIEKNIIFFNDSITPETINHAVKVSGMTSDLELLGGLHSVCVEQGKSLSGGQRSRLATARAVASNKDILLLDSVFSAIDSKLAKRIFFDCIIQYLKEEQKKTVVLVTHHLHYTQFADSIIVMENGRIQEFGKFKDLVNKENGKFHELYKKIGEEKTSENELTLEIKEEEKIIETKKNEKKEKNGKNIKNLIISDSGNSKTSSFFALLEFFGLNPKDKSSFSLMKILILLFIIAVFFVTMGLYLFSDWWIINVSSTNGLFIKKESNIYQTYYYSNSSMNNNNSSFFINYDPLSLNNSNICVLDHIICYSKNISIFWTSLSSSKNNYDLDFDLNSFQISEFWGIIIFFITSSLIPILFWFRGIIAYRYLISISQSLFKTAMKRLMNSKITFFFFSTLGMIMNIFTLDLKSLDIFIPQYFYMSLGTLIGVINTLILLGGMTYGLFVPFGLLIIVIYLILFWYYRKFSRQLKIIESKKFSPLLSHISENISGISTIKGFGNSIIYHLIKQNQELIDTKNRAHIILLASSRWILLYLSIVGFLISFIIGVISIIIVYYLPFITVPISFLKFAIARSCSFSFLFAWSVFYIIEFENQLVSADRINYFKKNVQIEEEFVKSNNGKCYSKSGKSVQGKKEKDGTINGEIVFENVSAKYHDDLPIVIKDLSFKIEGGEKIGIVGRTGSGKSTILYLCVRFLEILKNNGKIIIDGKNISSLSLQNLRKQISVVPQEATLFEGTIRSNIDPNHIQNDNEIWEAIEKVGIKHFFKKDGLDTKVEENGNNFSAGIKQLICLCRALVRNSKILLFDEISSSVDHETDQLIQKTIREEFKDSTVITIAHRLTTIADMEKIMVMADGKLIEFDTPKNLLLKESYSVFKSMVDESVNVGQIKKMVLGDSSVELQYPKLVKKNEVKEKSSQPSSNIYYDFFASEQ